MAQYNLGRVVPIFQGDYNPETNYECLDVVLYQGSSYVAKIDTLGNDPTDPTYWQMVASAGAGGSGVIDENLSTTSINPVQNKVITLKINELESLIIPESTIKEIIEGYKYQNAEQVETAITSKGYQTSEQVETAITSKQYVKKTDVATINGQTITNGGNINIEGGGAAVVVDSSMSLESENPVQNKVITKRINDVEGKIKPVPTKVSELDNDSDFQSKSQVDDNIAGHGFQTASQVNSAIDAKGYTTMAAVQAQNYQTASQVETTVTSKGYQTSEQVESTITGKDYATNTRVNEVEDKIPTAVTVDQTLDAMSTNAVANKAVTEKINQVESAIPTDTVTTEQLNDVKTIVESKTDMSSVQTYITEQGFAKSSEIPTDNKNLTNGAGYQTAQEVETAVTSKGYQTAQEVETAVTSKGYQTAQEVETAVTSKGYQTSEQVESAITGKDYATNNRVNEVEGKIPAAVTVDQTLDAMSTNAVANKAVTEKINQVESAIPTDTVTTEQLNAVKTIVESKTDMASVEAKGYQTAQEVETAVTSKGYQTSAQVESAITGKDYATNTRVNEVEKKIPAAVTVDQTLDAMSTNAVANKAVTEAISVRNIKSIEKTALSTQYEPSTGGVSEERVNELINARDFVPRNNFKTINNVNLTDGPGNVDISGGGGAEFSDRYEDIQLVHNPNIGGDSWHDFPAMKEYGSYKLNFDNLTYDGEINLNAPPTKNVRILINYNRNQLTFLHGFFGGFEFDSAHLWPDHQYMYIVIDGIPSIIDESWKRPIDENRVNDIIKEKRLVDENKVNQIIDGKRLVDENKVNQIIDGRGYSNNFETFTFEMEDGSIVTKNICIRQ